MIMSFFTDTTSEDNETTETFFFSQKIVSEEEEEDEEESAGLRLYAIDSATSNNIEDVPLTSKQVHAEQRLDNADDDLSSVEQEVAFSTDEDKGPSHDKALIAPIITSVSGNTNVISEQEVLKPLPTTVSISTNAFPANKPSQAIQQQKAALQKPSIGSSAFTNKKPPFRPIAKPSPATELKVLIQDLPKPIESHNVEDHSKTLQAPTEFSHPTRSSGKQFNKQYSSTYIQ